MCNLLVTRKESNFNFPMTSDCQGLAQAINRCAVGLSVRIGDAATGRCHRQ